MLKILNVALCGVGGGGGGGGGGRFVCVCVAIQLSGLSGRTGVRLVFLLERGRAVYL